MTGCWPSIGERSASRFVEFRPPGVTRFQPLRGIARFYRFRRPFGFLWMGGLRKGFRFHRTFDIE